MLKPSKHQKESKIWKEKRKERKKNNIEMKQAYQCFVYKVLESFYKIIKEKQNEQAYY